MAPTQVTYQYVLTEDECQVHNAIRCIETYATELLNEEDEPKQ
jgi:hypothetical protein